MVSIIVVLFCLGIVCYPLYLAVQDIIKFEKTFKEYWYEQSQKWMGKYFKEQDNFNEYVRLNKTSKEELYKLLDIAAFHFTEGHYGWPSHYTHDKIIEHWLAKKEPVPDVHAEEK